MILLIIISAKNCWSNELYKLSVTVAWWIRARNLNNRSVYKSVFFCSGAERTSVNFRDEYIKETLSPNTATGNLITRKTNTNISNYRLTYITYRCIKKLDFFVAWEQMANHIFHPKSVRIFNGCWFIKQKINQTKDLSNRRC